MILRAILCWAVVGCLIAASYAYQPVRVVDGDTIVMAGERIRLSGLDCPEMNQPGGTLAKRALESLLAGRAVTLERLGTDRYGRTVARVYVNGSDVSCAMIRGGWCRRYERYDRANRYGACR